MVSKISDATVNDPSFQLNIAAYQIGTYALGPGYRAAIWVQGCPFHCPGCIAPEWIGVHPNQIVDPSLLAEQILADPDIDGLTLSGGEPMLQAAGLARLVRLIREKRTVNVITFSGFQYQNLRTNPPNVSVSDLLHETDILVDGPFIKKLNDDRGLRGSSNQRFIALSDQIQVSQLENWKRKIEINISNGSMMVIGIPDRSILNKLEAFEPRMFIPPYLEAGNVRA